MKKKAITTTPTTPKISAKEATAEKVLNLLLSKLSHGVNAWRKPWDCKGNPTADPRFFAVNLFTGKPYNGINSQTLEAGFYAGFSQITANGGKVKKGSNSYPVVWFGSFEKDLPEQEAEDFFWNVFDVNKSKPASGKYGPCYKFAPNFYEVYNVYLDENCDLVKVTKDCKILKAENVFSIEDTEGLESFVAEFWKNFKGKEKSEIFDANEKGDLWIEAYCDGAKLHGFHHDGGNSSYYSPSSDSIHLAKKTAYHSPAEYYSTAFHEMTHSSGAASRLNRDGIVNFDHFGSPRYAKEELISEMGAAMAMGFLGIDTEATNDNSAAYLGNWLRQKIGEKASEAALKTLMSASSSAKFAFAYIAEFYETAKTSKEEENKQKKTEEPETLPMLPAIIAPNASATIAAVFKADPAEDLTSLSDYEVALQISVASEQGDQKRLADLMAEKERRYQASKEGVELFPASGLGYPNGMRIRGCFFPSLNKLDTIEGYKAQVTTAESVKAKGGSYPDDFNKAHAEEFSAWHVAIVQKFIQMDGDKYEEFTHNLLADRAYLDGIGGSQLVNIDTLENAEMPAGINPWEHEKLHALRLTWATICIMVCNTDNQEAILVDPEGFEYARYVGFLPDRYNIEAPKGEAPQMSERARNMVKELQEHIELADNLQKSGEPLVDFIDFGNAYNELKEDKLFADWLKEHNLAMSIEGGLFTSFKWTKSQHVCYRLMPNGEPDPEHYNDGLIDVRNVQESCTMVFTTREGDTKTVCYDDNFFAPFDLLQAYKSLWRSDWDKDDKKALYIKKFKEYLIATGCSAEELEEAE